MPAAPSIRLRRSRCGGALVEALAALVLAATVVLPVLALVARAAPVAHDAHRARRLARSVANTHARLAGAGCVAPVASGAAAWRDGDAAWHARTGAGARRTQVVVHTVRGAVVRSDRSVACD